MASRELRKRLEALEASQSRNQNQITPGQDAAFNALRTYGRECITWEQFCADFPEISEADRRLAYEAVWSLGSEHPHLTESFPTIERPPWTVSQLESKVIHDDQAPDPRTD